MGRAGGNTRNTPSGNTTTSGHAATVRLFGWTQWDVRSLLPDGWQDDMTALARSHAADIELTCDSVTSREAAPDITVMTHIADGDVIAAKLPWLAEFYAGPARDLAQTLTREPVSVAAGVQYGVNLDAQYPGERYEAHVDSNPLQGLFYATTHPEEDGGTLVVSNAGDVRGVDAIEADATRICPAAGHLVIFDARWHSHYVSVLRRGFRVVAAMNFYVPSCPEDARPEDLSRHLFRQHL